MSAADAAAAGWWRFEAGAGSDVAASAILQDHPLETRREFLDRSCVVQDGAVLTVTLQTLYADPSSNNDAKSLRRDR